MGRWNPNQYEQEFMSLLQKAKQHCKGELEINLCGDDWYAMDYREELGGAFDMVSHEYAAGPIITGKTTQKYKIDVIKCCDECNVYCVG